MKYSLKCGLEPTCATHPTNNNWQLNKMPKNLSNCPFHIPNLLFKSLLSLQIEVEYHVHGIYAGLSQTYSGPHTPMYKILHSGSHSMWAHLHHKLKLLQTPSKNIAKTEDSTCFDRTRRWNQRLWHYSW